MTAPDVRFERERFSRGVVRAARLLASMPATADVLEESREILRVAFSPDLVCLARCARDGVRCSDACALRDADIEGLPRTVSRVIETGSVSVAELDLPSPTACVVLPVNVHGRTETAILVGYSGAPELPSHVVQALRDVADLVGATLARQQLDRERMTLAVERATRAVAEQTENRARLLSKASKALVASFDSDGTLSSLARLIVPQLAHWCTIALRRESGPTAAEQVVWVQVDPSSAEGSREVRADRGPIDGAERVIATCEPELHPQVPESFLARWARSPEQLRLARGLGLASAIVVPIAGHGAVLGAIALGASDRQYAPEDVAAAEELGLRTGTAIENARLYLQAQQAIGARDQFLAVASHELNTPLTALMLVVDAAERALEKIPDPPERMRANVAALARQGQRLTKLVSNLLDVTRIQAGLLHLSIEPMDLCAVVREVAARHEPEAARARCALEVVACGAITATWDPGRVDQVVSNLLSNALKYGAGKPVSLVAEVDGDVARLSVTDRGSGIAPEDHERIFQRFERAVPDGGPEGMGLGLWITREIVLRLGGSIRVESGPGAGARFIVELPLQGVPAQR